MGFPVCYSELLLPKLLLHFLSLFTLLRRLISSLLRLAGLPDFLDSPSSSDSDFSPSFPDGPYLFPPSSSDGSGSGSLSLSLSLSQSHSLPAALLREVLPIVVLSELPSPPESCAVCLYEFEPQHEARRLPNCCHVFHRCCLDRWIGYGHRTCPLCRTSLVPDDFAETHGISKSKTPGID
ncbi:hypothetical protein CRG98_023776 [Punica granatum]|uniref:RING-type domain-containing protein n=1 Tax=Punica granatum TaxID=22663 RepID=A0A2I0JHU5_PUNGR|nr:hypothetical protein CRG98_023776 [Punica granatum]